MKQKFDDPIERSSIVLKIIFVLQGLVVLIGIFDEDVQAWLEKRKAK